MIVVVIFHITGQSKNFTRHSLVLFDTEVLFLLFLGWCQFGGSLKFFRQTGDLGVMKYLGSFLRIFKRVLGVKNYL